ncbi:MAG TPA: zinc ABC transporter ATP-binding protein [Firmicutes bacterium]|nr:zinc ABC transporter ATP-binding protein [Bacillota bacterium]
MSHPVLELDKITFYYGDRLVLDQVSLSVCSGDFLGIVGPNGSGKSTLLKIIAGLLKPAAGSVRIFGAARENSRRQTRIGYVAQNVTSFNHAFPATVGETVIAGLTGSLGLLRRPGQREKRLVEETLAGVGLADLRDRLVGELSGGQQQRVFIARALVAEPALLLLDEPTIGVDVDAKEKFYGLLAALRREHDLTLLMVSHDLGVVARLAQSIACLNSKLYFHGPPAEFWTEDVLCQAYGAAVRILHHGDH